MQNGSDGVNYVFPIVDSVLYKARLTTPDAAFTDISPPGQSGKVVSYDLSSENFIIASTGEAGFWRSDDGGATWAEKNDGLPCQKTRAIRIISSNLILAAVRCNDRDEVYRSSDGGESWSRGVDFGPGVYVNRFNISRSGRAIAMTTSGLYFSSDGGQSWVNANTMSYFAALPSDADVKDMASTADSSGIVNEVDLVQGVGAYVVVNSTQAGATAILHNDGLPAVRFGQRISGFNGKLHIPVKGYGLYAQENGRWVLKLPEQTLPGVNRVVALPSASNTLFASTRNQGLWRSNDSGATWTKVAMAPALTVSALFDWAETSYSDFFPGHQTDQTLPPYTYRYYPSTGNYLGTDGSFVYVLGTLSGNQLQSVGKLSDLTCVALPATCSNH
ncbi:MAG: hypothetical protein PHX60_01380 [Giesbergeria sp.]|uniref:hypothetical protein n=1 Tax=Giesbergeria sp. TaxID=2818473 RepID=UPI00262C5089|nr:hypothetical protein [Giesbergeria sp.]MDD2608330.1 hypothetical protein [Giesbergeria sp.]